MIISAWWLQTNRKSIVKVKVTQKNQIWITPKQEQIHPNYSVNVTVL